MKKVWRHGDILIETAAAIPPGARKRPTVVLAWGELTGHSHRIEAPAAAEIWERREATYLNVLRETARLVHQEHKPITLPRGVYRFWHQREYTPQAIRRVVD